MKNITVSVNEQEYRLLKERVKKKGTTIYAVVKKQVKSFIESEVGGVCVLYAFILYSVVVAVQILF